MLLAIHSHDQRRISPVAPTTSPDRLAVHERDAVLAFTTDVFILPEQSPHGPDHWQRVRHNGLLLAEQTGANPRVVELFAFFHDSCRETDGWDITHGPRGAELVREHYESGQLPASATELELIVSACEGHTVERTHADPTIATCWDADRLDLPRVGITVNPEYLCTEAARDPQIIAAAEARARRREILSF
jgi:uncharacterized protein